MKRKFSKEQLREIAEDFVNETPYGAIKIKYNINSYQVNRALRKHFEIEKITRKTGTYVRTGRLLEIKQYQNVDFNRELDLYKLETKSLSYKHILYTIKEWKKGIPLTEISYKIKAPRSSLENMLRKLFEMYRKLKGETSKYNKELIMPPTEDRVVIKKEETEMPTGPIKYNEPHPISILDNLLIKKK